MEAIKYYGLILGKVDDSWIVVTSSLTLLPAAQLQSHSCGVSPYDLNSMTGPGLGFAKINSDKLPYMEESFPSPAFPYVHHLFIIKPPQRVPSIALVQSSSLVLGEECHKCSIFGYKCHWVAFNLVSMTTNGP